jgi:TolB-like protein
VASHTLTRFRIREFELDAATGELRKAGTLVKLQPQPFRVLLLLVERAGQLVTREEIQRCLWTDSTFVDFEHGINFSINQIREALEDDAEKPRYVETLPRRGYRFVAQVEEVNEDAAGTSTQASIAVLPFANMSADPENEFFADGITEEIINALTRIEELRVAACRSAFSFKGKHVDLRIIGERLNVKTILEGSVRRAGSRVRIMAQLINVADGYHLWAESYDRELKEIFEVQDEVALAIVSRLKVTLRAGQQPSVKAGTSNLEAYQLYLAGRALLHRGGLDIRRAAHYFERAVALDPQYPLAWSGLADARIMLGLNGLSRPGAVMPQAREAATRAVTLDPMLAEAHCSLAMIHVLHDWERSKAEQEFLHALALNPRSLQNLTRYAFYLTWVQGRVDEGIALAKQALEYDPLSGYAHATLALSYYWAGRGAEAVVAANAARELEESFIVYYVSQVAFHQDHQFAKAAAAGEMALALSGRNAFALASQATIYADWGKIADAQAIHSELVARAALGYIPAIRMAIAASAAGEPDLAVAHAREAFEARDPRVPWEIAVKNCPEYVRLREDARFNELVARKDLK